MAGVLRRTKVQLCARRPADAGLRPRRFAGPLPALLAGAALLLAGCGASASPRPDASAAGPATVVTMHVSGYGAVLATSAGRVLYLISTDPPDGSKCSGSCATQWRPLTDAATPTAGPGVDGSMLTTFRRADGSRQVVYDAHALYTYTGPGQTGAAGIAANGGISYLVSPAGHPIKQTAVGGY